MGSCNFFIIISRTFAYQTFADDVKFPPLFHFLEKLTVIFEKFEENFAKIWRNRGNFTNFYFQFYFNKNFNDKKCCNFNDRNLFLDFEKLCESVNELKIDSRVFDWRIFKSNTLKLISKMIIDNNYCWIIKIMENLIKKIIKI